MYSAKCLFEIQRKFNKILLYQSKTLHGFASGEIKPSFSWDFVLQSMSQLLCPDSSPCSPSILSPVCLSPMFGWERCRACGCLGFDALTLWLYFKAGLQSLLLFSEWRRRKDNRE